MRSTARRNKSIQPEQQAIVTVPSVEVHEPAFDPTWQHQPSAEKFEDGEAIAPLNAQEFIQENSAASTGQKQGSFEIGDRVTIAARVPGCDRHAVWVIKSIVDEDAEVELEGDPEVKCVILISALQPVKSELPFIFYPNFLAPGQADRLLERSSELEWQNNTIRMYGKRIPLPRLEAMYGDAGCSYTYSNSVLLEPLPWVKPLQQLRDLVQQVTGSSYQVVIGNQYRDGSDHIGWHSDDSPEMGESPAIASISLGATRHFKIRHKVTKETHEFDLTHGSLLVMHPGCQTDWQHCITKTSKEVGMRINWTFRPHLNGAPVETGEAISVSPSPVNAPSEKPDSLSDNSPVDAEILTLTESDRLIESLYQRLQESESEASAAFNRATRKYFELGLELLKRRPEFPRGTWLKWLAERGIDERYAQRSMQIAEHFGENPDSLPSLSVQDVLRQIQKKLPAVNLYTLREVREAYEAFSPGSFKFHSVGECPYSFEVQGFSSYFHSLEQAMERLPVLRDKYGRIAEYQSVDELSEPQGEEMGAARGAVQPAYKIGDRLTSKSGNAEVVAIDGDTLVLNQKQENGVTSSRVPIAKADKNWQPVSEERLTGTDAQTLKDLCEYHGLRKVAIAVLLSATLDQLDEIGNWISERQLQLE